MSEVSSVVLKYAVRGADSAQRKDKQVRDSIKRTGKQAQKQAGSVRKWMQRHKAAIAGIAAATAGALMAILKHSPTLRGELAGARLAFSLFAMTVGEDVAPALQGISDLLLDITDAYSDLDPAVRKPISGLIAFGLAAAFAASTLAILEGVFAGTVIAAKAAAIGGALYTAAGGAAAAALSFLGLTAATAALAALVIGVVFGLGLLASELLGVTDVTGLAAESHGQLIDAMLNLIFVIAGPFIAILGVLYAFWVGGWENAKRVALRFAEEIWNAFMRLGIFLAKHILRTTNLIRTGFETLWNIVVKLTKDFINWMISKTQGGINKLLKIVINLRHRVPALFVAMWEAVKSGTADALNVVLDKAESTINRMIKAMNKIKGVDIGTVSFGSVDFDARDVSSVMEKATERAKRQFGQQKMQLEQPFDTKAISEIQNEGRQSLRERQRVLNRRVGNAKQKFSSDQIRFQQGPSPGKQQPVEDKSVNIERFEVINQSQGDEQLDGDQIGQQAMSYIEEQQQKRE